MRTPAGRSSQYFRMMSYASSRHGTSRPDAFARAGHGREEIGWSLGFFLNAVLRTFGLRKGETREIRCFGAERVRHAFRTFASGVASTAGALLAGWRFCAQQLAAWPVGGNVLQQGSLCQEWFAERLDLLCLQEESLALMSSNFSAPSS